MISHARRCIFVHIPKTGGTSLGNLIWPKTRTAADLWAGFVDVFHNKYQTGGLQHLQARQIRAEVGPDIFSSYFKFAIVRNPWDKAVSQFASMPSRDDLRAFIGMKKDDSFKKYLELTGRKLHVQWDVQVNFLYDENGRSMVDYTGRYESFADAVHYVLNRLGTRVNVIPHKLRGNRGPYQDYFDDESRALIADRYAADIRAFGYAFEDVQDARQPVLDAQ